MWLVTLNNPSDFEHLKQSLPQILGLAPYIEESTTSGAPLAISPERSPLPHLVQIEDDPLKLHAIVESAHHRLRPEAIISSGSALECGQKWDASKPLVPAMCYRHVGALQVGSTPLLFEDIPFDREIQSWLANSFKESDLWSTSDETPSLFGAQTQLASAELRDWIAGKLPCHATDGHSAELLIAGRHLGVRVGCLKTLASPGSRELLARAWTHFLSRSKG